MSTKVEEFGCLVAIGNNNLIYDVIFIDGDCYENRSEVKSKANEWMEDFRSRRWRVVPKEARRFAVCPVDSWKHFHRIKRDFLKGRNNHLLEGGLN